MSREHFLTFVGLALCSLGGAGRKLPETWTFLKAAAKEDDE